MKLSFLFENSNLEKFVKFLDVIVQNKNEAIGVILNLTKEHIHAIYSYIDEHEEGDLNYIEYERVRIPYFFFEYQLQIINDSNSTSLQTVTQKVFIKQDKDGKDIDTMTLRLSMESFVQMYEFSSSIKEKYKTLYIKARGKYDEIKQAKKNFFYLYTDLNTYGVRDAYIPIKTARKVYDIRIPEVNLPYVQTSPTMLWMKIIGYKIIKKIENKKQYFVIYITKGQKDGKERIILKFIFDLKSVINYTLKFESAALQGDYLLDTFYLVDSSIFSTILKNYPEYVYNNECSLYFEETQLLFFFTSNGKDSKEQELNAKPYSSYCVSMAVAIKTKGEILEILSTYSI